MNDDVTALLTRLPEPTPPASLPATVMARIARAAENEPVPMAARLAPAQVVRDRLVWLSVLAGLAVILTGTAYGWLVDGTVPDLTAPRLGPSGPSLTVLAQPSGVLLGLGLLLCIAGLFAPLRGSDVT